MPENIRPFLLDDPDAFTSLEEQTSVIPPNLRDNYRELEIRVGKAFVEAFGQYLTKEQLEYMTSVHILFTDDSTALRFSKFWEKGEKTINLQKSSIDGYVYTNYTIVEDGKRPSHKAGEFPVRHYWAGRIAIFPLGQGAIHAVDAELLMTKADFDEKADALEDIPTYLDLIESFERTLAIGGCSLHEKVHGIQQHPLPIPILEAGAYHYPREIGRMNGWDFALHSNIRLFADLYADCVREIGNDLHRFIFGNIADESRAEEIPEYLKRRFSAKTIEAMSKHNECDWEEDRHNWIFWQRIPASEL